MDDRFNNEIGSSDNRGTVNPVNYSANKNSIGDFSVNISSEADMKGKLNGVFARGENEIVNTGLVFK